MPLVAAHIFAVSLTKKKINKEKEIFTLTKELISDSHHDVSWRAEQSFIPTNLRPSRHFFKLRARDFSVVDFFFFLSLGEASQRETESITERDAAAQQIFHLTPCRALE